MRIAFLGTPSFAIKALKEIHAKHEIVVVITQSDYLYKKGQIVMQDIKKAALDLNLKVFSPEKLSKSPEVLNELKKLNIDVFVTCAFGQILTEEILNIPKYYTLNIHASLLPQYRGASPMQQAILNGDTKTGVTIMKTVKQLDAGDILIKREIDILDSDSIIELSDKLSTLGAELIIEALDLVASDKAVFTKQDESRATFCSIIKKTEAYIDLNVKTAKEVINHIRAMKVWPSTFVKYKDHDLKIIEAELTDRKTCREVGTIYRDNKELYLACKDFDIRLISLQLAGKKEQSYKDFINGQRL